MAKEANKEVTMTKEKKDDSLGTVKIAENVVSMIAALAAGEVEGIVTHYKKPSERVTYGGAQNKYTKVDVTGDKVSVDIGIVVDYGYNLPSTSQKVQARVQSAIENMTGLQVTDVNVRILSVHVN